MNVTSAIDDSIYELTLDNIPRDQKSKTDLYHTIDEMTSRLDVSDHDLHNEVMQEIAPPNEYYY